MRFLVESGTYRIDNVGDIAMLQRTVRRLAEGFPNASISVVTERPEQLARVLPEVHAVPAGPWFRLRVVPVPRRWEWNPIVRRIRWREKLLAGRMPRLARAGKRMDHWATADERASADRFYQAVAEADAVVAAGGGYINDHYHEHAWKVFATLNLAQGLGKPTAMFSIGLGPISRHDLEWYGGRVLRRVSLLALRESATSPEIARRLGISGDRVVVTGDDAVAVAAQHSRTDPDARRCIGVNLRIAVDAEVPDTALPQVRSAVENVADTRGAEGIVPLVIRTSQSPENDVDAAARILGADGAEFTRARAIYSPQGALDEISRCRVIVTGAYHNAVFALAMGVPVVGLYRSAYYHAKLAGVAREFGRGMTLLSLDDPDLRRKLTSQLEQLWDESPTLCPRLREAAAAQVARSEAAYERFFAEIGGRADRAGSAA